MKIGLIVEGEAEYRSLSKIYGQLEAATGHQFLGPLFAKVPSSASAGIVAAEYARQATQHQGRGAELVVGLLDREDRDVCCDALATDLATEISTRTDARTIIVVKDRMYENWLVADVDAIKAMPARFDLSRTAERSIVPNKADNVDALRLLRTASLKKDYAKVPDSVRILDRVDVERLAKNSRSFRRFLRVIEYPEYRLQSRTP